MTLGDDSDTRAPGCARSGVFAPNVVAMHLVMQLLADGIPPSLLCDLAEPDEMVAGLQAEVAEVEAIRALAELPSRAALEARSLRTA